MNETTRSRTTHLIVTGGTGYIGARVVAQALDSGCAVTVLTRDTGGLPDGVRQLPWRLGEALPDAALILGAPAGTQALVHLAHDWTNPSGDDGACGLNLTGTRTLLEGARRVGLGRFVFVSSQSARQDAENIYGRVKWQIEQLLDRPGEISARVGLVYGGPCQAMFGLLCRLVARAPVLPMIDPWREVQPIHVDEVARGLLLLAERGGEGWFGLAAPEGLAFGTFLRTLALEFYGRRLPMVPVPIRAALLACDATAAVPFGPTVDRERVLGLAGTRPMACAAHLQALGLAPVPLEQGLRNEPTARRALLREGRLLLHYVLGTTPSGALLRRYARAVARRGEGAIAVPGLLRAVPALLRAGEPLSGTSALGRRLRLASTLAESSAEGEAALAAGSRAHRLAMLAGQGAVDVAMLPVRLALALRRR